jgi:hypothetical protein
MIREIGDKQNNWLQYIYEKEDDRILKLALEYKLCEGEISEFPEKELKVQQHFSAGNCVLTYLQNVGIDSKCYTTQQARTPRFYSRHNENLKSYNTQLVAI